MRILQISDLHGSSRALAESRTLIETHDPDLLIVSGDITNFGPVAYAEELFEGLPCPAYGIPGNCDPPEIVPLLQRLGVNLHGERVVFAGETLIGLGGSSPTPFHTPFELSETAIRDTLRPRMTRGAILVSHAPAWGHLDRVPSGHAGSRAVAALVREFAPKAVLSGHIHEARGIEAGPTTFVNPGPASQGYAARIDVGSRVEAVLLP